MKSLSLFGIALAFLAPCAAFAQGAAPSSAAEAVVAADGSAQYKSVQDAINASPQSASAAAPWTIRIKPGVYRERIQVQREKRWVHLIGEDAASTTITFNLRADMKGDDSKPIGTFRTPTAWIDADDLTAGNLTFENSAGPGSQALAARLDGDRMIFRNCRFVGFQDTILANRGRQYFEDCYIAGATDFIFGGATAWFERCRIDCTKSGYITAASTPQEQPFGFVFNRCTITGRPGAQMFLGRPWRAYAATAFLNTSMDGSVRPAGWNNWNQPDREKTARYAEYRSTGPGGTAAGRAPWSKQLTDAEAAAMTVAKVLGGADGWNPATAK